METSFLTPEELAERWHISLGTLNRWRIKGTGLRFSQTEDGIFYELQDIDAYERSRTYHSTAEYPPELKYKAKSKKQSITYN